MLQERGLWGTDEPAEEAVAPGQGRRWVGTQMPVSGHPWQDPIRQPNVARDPFELQHMMPSRKCSSSQHIGDQRIPGQRLGLYAAGDGRERAVKARIAISQVRTV